MAIQPKEFGDYVVQRTLGKGGFGTVYLCKDKYTKEEVAVKEIKKKLKIDPKTEIEIHNRLMKKRSNRVVKIFRDFEIDGSVYLVMEYCKEGSLRDYVKIYGAMNVLLATDVLSQLCDALKLIHEEDIAHRDLTPNNVLIWEIKKGRNNDVKRIRVKVTDFGLSKETPKNAKGQFKTTLGTGPFMAPEVLAGRYTKAADVFALGSMFYFLLTKNYLPDKLISNKHLELSPILNVVMEINSIKMLSPKVQENLKAFMLGMLCNEEDRIRLDEIDKHEFMNWFYAERYEIDPELRELCSHSHNGNLRGRSSRSQSRESTRKPQVQTNKKEVQKRSNKDSAFVSDQSHSGSGRCRHLQIDKQTGRCRTCLFRINGIEPKFDQLHLSEPVKVQMLPDNLTDVARKAKSNITHLQGASTSKDKQLETTSYPNISHINEAIYTTGQPPWPLPTITHNYSAVNEHGRCIFYKYSSVRGQFQLVAILEKTTSKDDQTICKIFELRQNDIEQELLILQPERQNMRKPGRNDERLGFTRDVLPIIRSCSQFRNCKIAKHGYETLWSFLKMAASRIVQAYCEEITNGRKYRVELCLNGWANLFIGPKEAKDFAHLKLFGKQKVANGRFEQIKTEDTIDDDEKSLAIDLVNALRIHVKESVWKRQFNKRNVRCTIYTNGFG